MASRKPTLPREADAGQPPIEWRPLVEELDIAALHQPQGPDSGMNAIIGRWPGDESDEEILALLEELS
jgi:hypothetical protein